MAAASVLRNVVMDGTGECKRTQCGPIEDDVKHKMVGEEGEYARGRREDCALGVIVHGHCRERACRLLLVLQRGKKYVNIWNY